MAYCFPQSTVPIHCLPFDGIGAWHLGMTHDAANRQVPGCNSTGQSEWENLVTDPFEVGV